MQRNKILQLHKITKLMYPAEPNSLSLYFKFNKHFLPIILRTYAYYALKSCPIII